MPGRMASGGRDDRRTQCKKPLDKVGLIWASAIPPGGLFPDPALVSKPPITKDSAAI